VIYNNQDKSYIGFVLKYRPEIDGLRALAVVPVILFHAGFELFSGGFVGVDVFFVISGYLITSLLIEDIENKRFSILHFYERRARRILPALLFVTLVCIPFAWMWMLPSQMKDFSQSLIAVSLFASNILFWRESGYFDTAVEEKPLLHTWSLAVEEQYYVLFPIFLILAWRFGKNRVFWMIVVMAAFSLLLSEWGWRNKAIANFYLIPTRAWELFAGSIAAFVVQKQGTQKNNLLALFGLSAIVFSIFFYDESTPFPSVYALVPVIGVVLLVLFADKDTFTAKLLSTKGFVGIGLISYSAYLWHQPILAFGRIYISQELPLSFILATIFATTILAYITWKYIESPFRSKSLLSSKNIAVTSLVGLLTLCATGILYLNDSLPSRAIDAYLKNITPTSSSSMQLENECFLLNEELANFAHDCASPEEGKFNLLLIGDSHAAALYPGFDSLSDTINVDLMSATNCLPIVTQFPKNKSQNATSRCSLINNQVIEAIRTKHYDIILLSAYMYEWGSGGEVWTYPGYYSDFISQLRTISKHSNIAVLGQVPIWKPNLLTNVAEDALATGFVQIDKYSSNGIPVDFFEFNTSYKTDVHDLGLEYIDVVAHLCSDNRCKRFISTSNSQVLTSSDYGHIGLEAARYYVSSLVFPFLQIQILEKNERVLRQPKAIKQ